MPVKRKWEISIGQRLAGEPHFHDVVVEVGDLRPTLSDLGAEQVWVAATGEPGVAVVVDHDPVPPHKVTIGTGERRMSAIVLLRLAGQLSIEPSGVAAQSKFAMISAASPPPLKNG
jgi:hypothetical protein